RICELVSCVKGAVLDVCVDIRKGSPTFGETFSIELNDENRFMLFIPKGLAHGFSVLSEQADFFYKCSDYYLPSAERGVLWNDEALGINWKVQQPILSEKDTKHPVLSEILTKDLPVFKD
ncbi:dTDP-4-keto-6-deoxy-D-glucose epimerase, partial [bacterium]